MANGRCRLHGGLSTGPKKTPEGIERIRRAVTKHGAYSAAAKAERRRVRKLIRDAEQMMKANALWDDCGKRILLIIQLPVEPGESGITLDWRTQSGVGGTDTSISLQSLFSSELSERYVDFLAFHLVRHVISVSVGDPHAPRYCSIWSENVNYTVRPISRVLQPFLRKIGNRINCLLSHVNTSGVGIWLDSKENVVPRNATRQQAVADSWCVPQLQPSNSVFS